MPFTHDQLESLGYRRQSDGSYSRTTATRAPRAPDTVPQPNRAQALDRRPPAQERGQGRTVVRITRVAPRLLDPDNLAGGCKFLIDAMRHAGLIPNDDPASIELVTLQRQCRRGEERTEIELVRQNVEVSRGGTPLAPRPVGPSSPQQ
jgi:hypothetical protein